MRVIESVGFLSLFWHTILWCFDFILWHDVASYLHVCWDSAFTFTSVIKLPKDLKLKGVHLVVSTYWTSAGGDTLWALSGCLVSRQGSGVKELKILVRQGGLFIDAGLKWDSMIPCCFFHSFCMLKATLEAPIVWWHPSPPHLHPDSLIHGNEQDVSWQRWQHVAYCSVVIVKSTPSSGLAVRPACCLG